MLQVTRSVVLLPEGHDQYPQYDELDKSSELYDRNKAMTMVLGCCESGLKEMPVLPLTVDPNRILDDFEREKGAWRRQLRRESNQLARQREQIAQLASETSSRRIAGTRVCRPTNFWAVGVR